MSRLAPFSREVGKREDLLLDASWGAALQSLKLHFSPDPSRFTDYDLSVCSAPAAPDRTAAGQGRGQFSEYGSETTRSLYEDRDGYIWCGLSVGVRAFRKCGLDRVHEG